MSIYWDRNIRSMSNRSRSTPEILRFQPIPPLIFPLQSLFKEYCCESGMSLESRLTVPLGEMGQFSPFFIHFHSSKLYRPNCSDNIDYFWNYHLLPVRPGEIPRPEQSSLLEPSRKHTSWGSNGNLRRILQRPRYKGGTPAPPSRRQTLVLRFQTPACPARARSLSFKGSVWQISSDPLMNLREVTELLVQILSHRSIVNDS